MNLQELLKYGDKYTNYIFLWKNEEAEIEDWYWSANGSDDLVIFSINISIYDLVVTNYKVLNNILYVVVKPANQKFDSYNFFPYPKKIEELENLKSK